MSALRAACSGYWVRVISALHNFLATCRACVACVYLSYQCPAFRKGMQHWLVCVCWPIHSWGYSLSSGSEDLRARRRPPARVTVVCWFNQCIYQKVYLLVHGTPHNTLIVSKCLSFKSSTCNDWRRSWKSFQTVVQQRSSI